jgi:3-oxoadipate enol-lactonase
VPLFDTADGRTIHYLDSGGDGAPLLVLFGFGNTAESASAPWLALLTAVFRVLRPDHRGVGSSSPPAEPFSIEDLAADALAVLDHAGVQRAHVFGHSMGGMIAQAVARDHPDRVRRVVLEATAPSPAASVAVTAASTAPATQRFRTDFMADDPGDDDDEAAITPGNAVAFFAHFLAPGFVATERGAAVVREMSAVYARVPGPTKRTLRWQRQAVMAFDNWPRLGEIRAPALVVHPSLDLKPRERAEAFAAGLGDGRLRVVPGAGHDLRWEQPEVSASIVVDFLGGS